MQMENYLSERGSKRERAQLGHMDGLSGIQLKGEKERCQWGLLSGQPLTQLSRKTELR